MTEFNIYNKNPQQTKNKTQIFQPDKKHLGKKSTSNIITNGERLITSLLRLGTKQGCPSSLLLFNIVVEVLGQLKKKAYRLERKKENCLHSQATGLFMEKTPQIFF